MCGLFRLSARACFCGGKEGGKERKSDDDLAVAASAAWAAKSSLANIKTFPPVHNVVCVSILLVFLGFAMYWFIALSPVWLMCGFSFQRFALFRFVDRVFVVFSCLRGRTVMNSSELSQVPEIVAFAEHRFRLNIGCCGGWRVSFRACDHCRFAVRQRTSQSTEMLMACSCACGTLTYLSATSDVSGKG